MASMIASLALTPCGWPIAEGVQMRGWGGYCSVLFSMGCAMSGPVEAAQAGVQVEWESYDAYRIADERNEMVLGSVGAIEHYGTYEENGATATNATCGATFISPHFAVTAGHCVVNIGDGFFIDEGEFYVDQIDVSSVSPADRLALAEVTGSGWQNWETGSSFDPPPGYESERYLCRVKCGYFGVPLGAGSCSEHSGISTLDHALVECPTRPASADWVIVEDAFVPVGKDVDVWWFHEYLEMPQLANGTEQWQRYGARADYNGNGTFIDDGFHYDWEHLLWPMHGSQDMHGAQAEVTARGAYLSTNLFGCHGTSGSGVFAEGTTYLMGPIARGTFPPTVLCGYGMQPINPAETIALEQRTDVEDDRDGTYTASF